ncbi:hypothetical protein C8R43DRAFT_948165 [Mycena crocata]|nr:hypothetical protein C8R43DRAFT_948165 [Mycena crocata]
MPRSSSPVISTPPEATHPLPQQPQVVFATPPLSQAAHRTTTQEARRTNTTHRDACVDPEPVTNVGPALLLENTGSVVRDHLANERTFLAYVRTSLTIASAGVALAQLLSLSGRMKSPVLVPLKPLDVYARPLAVSAIVLALYVLFVGVSRFFAIQAALTRGRFPVTRARLALLALGLVGIVSLLFGLLVAERTRQR